MNQKHFIWCETECNEAKKKEKMVKLETHWQKVWIVYENRKIKIYAGVNMRKASNEQRMEETEKIGKSNDKKASVTRCWSKK